MGEVSYHHSCCGCDQLFCGVITDKEMNLKKTFSHKFTQIYTDTSNTHTNKVAHLFGEVFYLFRYLFYRYLSVSIRGQLRFSG